MTDINFKTRCETCLGTGDYVGIDITTDQPLPVTTCPACNGVGFFLMHKIDVDVIMDELGDIRTGLTAIWNKVKNL